MSSKNPEKSLQREANSKVNCSDTSTAKETHRKLLRSATKTKRMPFFYFELGDSNSVALQRTVWWFLYKTFVSEQENISQVICCCLPPLQFLQVQTKHRINQQVHIPKFYGNVKIVQNERIKRRTVIDNDEDDWLEMSDLPSWNTRKSPEVNDLCFSWK